MGFSNYVALGWRHDLEDRGFLAASGGFLAPANYERRRDAPAIIDPTGMMPIENQKRMGSCYGHGATSVVEVVQYFQSGGKYMPQLSRFFAYIMGQRKAGIQGDNGCTIAGGIQSLIADGLLLEEFCPYPGDDYNPDVHGDFDRLIQKLITQDCIARAVNNRIRRHVKITDYDGCFDFLGAGLGGIIIGIPWTEELAYNKTGIIESAGGNRLGGHCVAIVGYSDRRDSAGRQYLILVNSHGEKWGNRGVALVAPSLFDSWGQDGFSELGGVSDLEDFTLGPQRMQVFRGSDLVVPVASRTLQVPATTVA